jgi:NAD(P)-dependent dehydrogenase (short-subunit alcohol dehydrogenase family)
VSFSAIPRPRDPRTDVFSGGDRGWIINISSILGLVGMAGASSYAATKGAVLQMTKVRFFVSAPLSKLLN